MSVEVGISSRPACLLVTLCIRSVTMVTHVFSWPPLGSYQLTLGAFFKHDQNSGALFQRTSFPLLPNSFSNYCGSIIDRREPCTDFGKLWGLRDLEFNLFAHTSHLSSSAMIDDCIQKVNHTGVAHVGSFSWDDSNCYCELGDSYIQRSPKPLKSRSR